MKRFSEQFKKQADRISLRASERRDLRARLETYLEYHPLSTQVHKPVQTEPYAVWRFDFGYIRGVASLAAVFLAIVVPVAAEQSVPGDVLYPVKVSFNEEVRSTLTFSAYEKVEWETERLERRLSEARLLANEGKLTEAVQAEVAEAVMEHSEAAKRGLAVLRETDTDEAAIAEIAFASALEVQSEVLETEIERDEEFGGTSTVQTLAAVVAHERAAVNTASSSPSYEKLFARVEEETVRAYELFEEVVDAVSPEQKRDIERRFSDIERTVVAVNAMHNATTSEMTTTMMTDAATATSATSSEVEAELSQATPEPAAAHSDENHALEITQLTQVLSDTKKLIRFMTDIDVQENVTLEELVPVQLTDEEYFNMLQADITSAKQLHASLYEALDTVTNPGLVEKTFLGLNQVDARIERASTLMANKEYLAALAVLEEVTVSLQGIATMLETHLAPKESEVTPGSEVEESASSTEPTELPIATTSPEALE